MSTLLPVHASEHVLEGIAEYLTTTFSLANPDTAKALKSFLSDTATGMFRGPYVRTRLPYARATDWEGLLEWLPEWFTPYHHQAEAFQRLRSRDEAGERRPEPTLVITGTGSGKTEAFLYPVLAHAKRMRDQGQRGVKALLLYPMNALASDQANRLAKLLTSEPGLEGVDAGIYVGDQNTNVTKVTPDSLITDRDTLRRNPPDILLTNYKMLDELLLRPADREIWHISATSLQYLVLDEFHTYDGAQGTDVALLLRRLGLMLKANQPEGFLGEYADNPLGRVTPVATSATLGGEGDTGRVLEFAGTIFGEKLDPDALIGETVLSFDQWQEEMAGAYGGGSGASRSEMPGVETIREVLRAVAEDATGREHAEVVLEVMRTHLWGCGDTLEEMIAAYAAHPLTRVIIEAASEARPLIAREGEGTALPAEVLDPVVLRALKGEEPTEFVTHLLTAVAHLRALAGEKYGFEGKRLPGVDTHLWVREVSRIDRAVTPTADGSEFRWYDDGVVGQGADITLDAVQAEDQVPPVWLPACYCRACGRAGWATSLEPGTEAPILDPAQIRKLSIEAPERRRPLITAINELRQATTDGVEFTAQRDPEGKRTPMWLHTESRALSTTPPTEEDLAKGTSVPVLTYSGTDAAEYAKDEVCPSCGETDTIRFIGSRVATLLSVGLSNLFGMGELDQSEKKTLVFADSVQDAAHRAGFVQSRSHAFALRTFTYGVVGSDTVSLAELPQRIIDAAVDRARDVPGAKAKQAEARARYELLPPELADTVNYRPFWDVSCEAQARRNATREAKQRLAFDAALEFGQRADLARSLTLTGALNVAVDIPDAVLSSAAREAIDRAAVQTVLDGLEGGVADADAQLRWARGLVEQVRERGAINHPWLKSYLRDDGNSWHLHNRLAKSKGVPSFPRGGAPEFPRVGSSLNDKDRGITPLSSPRGRYARWTATMLGLSTHDAAAVLREFFRALASRNAVTPIQTTTGGTIYALEPEQVVVSSEVKPHVLRCGTCHAQMGVDKHARALMNGQACGTPGCSGTYEETPIEPNYYWRLYASAQPRTVVAKEHTSLVPPEERLALEHAFRGGETPAADAPNVLVATPTLEMGIDIGDLSTVMLASLPNTVANYVQRVGRAGRLTGNSLVLAFVQGRGPTLPKLNAPLGVIQGAVTPPAAFLSATEILHRQLAAYLIDSTDVEALGVHLDNAKSVFGYAGRPLVTALQEVIATGVDEQVDKFLDSLSGEELDPELLTRVRDWATGQGPETFTAALTAAREQWNAEVNLLRDRAKALRDVEVELQKRDANAAASVDTVNAAFVDEDLEREKRSVSAARKRTQRDLHNLLSEERWVAALERYGLLPNFTLIDDSVELAVAISYLNPTTMEFMPESFELERGVSSALQELAPGATFYARGIAATIDSVEMGFDGQNIEQWRLCPACSYGTRVAVGGGAATAAVGGCPQCGSAAFADKGQLMDVIQMRKVAAEVDRSNATIDSTWDERRTTFFHTAMTFAVPEHAPAGGRWYLSGGFGAEYLPQVELSWFNLGKGQAQRRMLGGREVDAPLFTLCRICGHVDSARGENSKWDHRPWCPKRKEREEDTVTTALGRTLRTQGVLLTIPRTLTAGDSATIPSLTAALRLGFKEVLGGDPDHLKVVQVAVPSPSGDGTIEALLLHDNVPGGTGYLSQFASSEQVRELFVQTYKRVAECECRNDDRLACADCLLPYTDFHARDVTSRGVAERAIRAILRNEAHPAADADAFEVAWEPQADAPAPDEGSSLELRFRELLRAALEARNVTVTDRPNAGRMELELTFPGADGEQWLMREQVNEGYTVPDFLFTHRRRSDTRQVAVFTDGYAYHASQAHFRFPQDMEKRSSLYLNKDYIPFSITDADLDWFEQETAKTVAAPGWVTPELRRQIAGLPELDRSAVDFLLASPLTQLLDYLKAPRTATFPALGQGLTSLTMGVPGMQLDTAGTLPRIALPGGVCLDIEVSGEPARLLLDASAGVLEREPWNQYLRMANVLWLTGRSVEMLTGEVGVDKCEPLPEPAETPQVDGAWAEAIEEFDDEATVVAAMRTLAAQHAKPSAEIGEELASLPTALIWREEKVALMLEDDPTHAGAEADLAHGGWTILHPEGLTAEAIPPALLDGQA
ncbi:DEAD/DEAH box helicase [Corynebacterium imitans]|uniref:DEAD/DEAH box helicase n=1 Tax=Corynebacterium imitans TaxID=156978 RepID=UPI001EF3610A|nr:DEAD/DEAH box helicase [Corynebacterium imitans]